MLIEAGRHPNPDGSVTPLIQEALGLTEDEVYDAVEALEEAGYLQAHWANSMSGRYLMSTKLRERGRRAVGIWPAANGVDALVDALRQGEETVDDPEEKNLIRRAAGAVGSVSRDVMVDVMAAVIARQSGVG